MDFLNVHRGSVIEVGGELNHRPKTCEYVLEVPGMSPIPVLVRILMNSVAYHSVAGAEQVLEHGGGAKRGGLVVVVTAYGLDVVVVEIDRRPGMNMRESDL